jgi:SAM-dependent methyltransferase
VEVSVSTDKDWEKFAQRDPFWAVDTREEFKSANLTDEAKQRFYEEGESIVQNVLGVLHAYFQCPSRLGLVLDHGCGVGRLLLALSRRSDRAIGIDVSTTMLRVCAENARAFNRTNIDLRVGDDTLSRVTEPVDLVTSCIVLQHVPPERGCLILANLLRVLRPGGWGYVQLTYANEIYHLPGEIDNRTGVVFRYYQRLGDSLHKLVRTPDRTLLMQMNHYNLNEVFCILCDQAVPEVHCRHTNHHGSLGIELFFRKAER